MAAIKADPENWRYIASGAPRTLAMVARELAGFRQEWVNHGIGRWAVGARSTDELLGDCGIVLTDRGPQLAFMMARSAWGRGFATEAGGAVLVHAFDTFDWPAVFASTHPRNVASRRVLEKLGMQFIRTIEAPSGPECWYEARRSVNRRGTYGA